MSRARSYFLRAERRALEAARDGWNAAIEAAATAVEPEHRNAYHYEVREALNNTAAAIRALKRGGA